MKIARTNLPGFDCFIILSEGLLDREDRERIENQLIQKYGEVTIYNTSSKSSEKDLWVTNKLGVAKDRHDDFQSIDFEFVLFKDPSFFI